MAAKENPAPRRRTAKRTAGSPQLRVLRGMKANANPARLDRLIHERVRLGIVSALAVNESLSFNELKQLLETTDGNLSVHARKLEDANYIVCAKRFKGRVPVTEYRLSKEGREALEDYINHMEALIESMKND